MKNSLKCQKLENLKYIYACLCAWSLSRVRLFVTLWIVAHQVSLSVGFSRQEYWKHWSGLPFTTPGDLPDSGIEPKCPVSPALAGRFFTTAPPGKSLPVTLLGNFFLLLPQKDVPGFSSVSTTAALKSSRSPRSQPWFLLVGAKCACC